MGLELNCDPCSSWRGQSRRLDLNTSQMAQMMNNNNLKANCEHLLAEMAVVTSQEP